MRLVKLACVQKESAIGSPGTVAALVRSTDMVVYYVLDVGVSVPPMV